MFMFETAYLSMGSNLGDRIANLREGLRLLERAGAVPRRVSSFFETEPVGYRTQPWFLNLALEIETLMPPEDLLRCCQRIELARGRRRPFPGGPRTLDLDILLYGDRVLEGPALTIPHPRMVERRFVLEPLAEIAPEVFHPLLRKSVFVLLRSCPDPSAVRIYSPGDSH
jgi:2-amino-4-hydroxy-6-hydroxymethyldihydropteridine diphosphokinase